MKVYYNEIEPFAAAWLRELMKAGAIPAGDVDERRIEDVQPDDVRGFDQCHWFAGIGVWAYALQCAGWGDRPVWTGSCPCQPFSQAGQQKGFDDARHLWPHWFRLIRECKPVAVFGEQVGNALPWFDLVSADMEGEGYAVGAAIMGAHSVGTPHIRQRLYFVAHSASECINRISRSGGQTWVKAEQEWGQSRWGGGVSAVVHSPNPRRAGARQHSGGSSLQSARFEQCGGDGIMGESAEGGWGSRASSETLLGEKARREVGGSIATSELGFANRLLVEQPSGTGARPRNPEAERACSESSGSGSVNFWSDAEWLYCRDEKYRPVEPFPEQMADGLAADLGFSRTAGGKAIFFPLIEKGKNRVGRLRGYGNALCAPQAQAFVEAYLEVVG